MMAAPMTVQMTAESAAVCRIEEGRVTVEEG